MTNNERKMEKNIGNLILIVMKKIDIDWLIELEEQ